MGPWLLALLSIKLDYQPTVLTDEAQGFKLLINLSLEAACAWSPFLAFLQGNSQWVIPLRT
jgi:hypothetical protein